MLSNDVQCNAQHFFMLILEKKNEKKKTYVNGQFLSTY